MFAIAGPWSRSWSSSVRRVFLMRSNSLAGNDGCRATSANSARALSSWAVGGGRESVLLDDQQLESVRQLSGDDGRQRDTRRRTQFRWLASIEGHLLCGDELS